MWSSSVPTTREPDQQLGFQRALDVNVQLGDWQRATLT
jgi:hypothetical protein